MACNFKANIINLQRNIIGSVITDFPQLSAVLSTLQQNPRDSTVETVSAGLQITV